MAMEITNNYSSYAAQTMTESGATSGTKKKGTEKTQETAGNSRKQQIQEYSRVCKRIGETCPKRRV